MGLFSKLKEKIFNKGQNEKYVNGLDKSNKSFLSKLNFLKSRYKVDEEFFEELEETLISADIGVNLALEIVDKVKIEAKQNRIEDVEKLNEVVIDKMLEIYKDNEIEDSSIKINKDGLTTILVVGVNGVGKTTSIAKIANRFKNDGKKVLLAASDTFRAGAVDQIEIWANKLNIDVVSNKQVSDPTSIIYDAINKATSDHYDILICDSAGRIQTKKALMDELAKMNRAIYKFTNRKIDEVLLVLDATTGQNGISQAKSFFDSCDVSGIVLTKMDSTSKGGIILAIKEMLNIPVKLICFGEQIDDIDDFKVDDYLYGLLKGVD